MDPVAANPSHAICPSALTALLGQPDSPLILDVRRTGRFAPGRALSPARAERRRAVDFDILGAPTSHGGDRGILDTLLGAFGLSLPAPAAGWLAVSLGMSRLHADNDHAMLEAMMPVYDALCAWCVYQVGGNAETHNWSPQ
jgi:hypothetical protein